MFDESKQERLGSNKLGPYHSVWGQLRYHFILFYFIFYYFLFYSILFHFIFFMLLYFLLIFFLFNFIQFNLILFYSVLFYSVLFSFQAKLCSAWHSSAPACSFPLIDLDMSSALCASSMYI